MAEYHVSSLQNLLRLDCSLASPRSPSRSHRRPRQGPLDCLAFPPNHQQGFSNNMSSQPVPPSAKEVASLPPPASSKASNNTLLGNNQLWSSPLDLFSYRHWMSDVDPQQSTMPLAAFCFMTGFMCVQHFLFLCFLRRRQRIGVLRTRATGCLRCPFCRLCGRGPVRLCVSMWTWCLLALR